MITKRILVRAGDPETVEILRHHFEPRLSLEIVAYGSSEDAIEQLGSSSFDLVVSDHFMPNGTSDDLLIYVTMRIRPRVLFVMLVDDGRRGRFESHREGLLAVEKSDRTRMLEVIENLWF